MKKVMINIVMILMTLVLIGCGAYNEQNDFLTNYVNEEWYEKASVSNDNIHIHVCLRYPEKCDFHIDHHWVKLKIKPEKDRFTVYTNKFKKHEIEATVLFEKIDEKMKALSTWDN